MKSLFSAKPLVLAAVALGAVAAGSVAHARSDVTFSIGFNAPYGYVQPAPVYVQPQQYYVQPQPYYQPAPIYIEPQVYHYQREGRFVQRAGAWGDRDRDGIPNIYDRNSRGHGNWDSDRDGVRDRDDRAPHNPRRR